MGFSTTIEKNSVFRALFLLPEQDNMWPRKHL